MTDEELIQQTHVKPEMLRGIRELRLMDDVYFTVFFDNFNAGMEVVLAPILGRPDIRVKQVITQRTAPNLYGRSARFDVLAEDSERKLYNCEVQRASKDAIPRRARFNSSMLDSREISRGTPFQNFPETYVIFITETDVFHRGQPLYKVERTFLDTHESFGDGTHILYANGACQDDTPLGRLMQDFFCTDPQKMHNPILADRAGFFKDKPEGVTDMNDILENIMKQRLAEAAKETEVKIQEAEKAGVAQGAQAANQTTARRLLGMGMTPEMAASATGLPVNEVRALSRTGA